MTSTIRPFITRKGQEDTGTGQSGGCVRISGVSPQHTPATRIWFGKVSNEPGYRSYPHHHGEAETGGYVLKGKIELSVAGRTYALEQGDSFFFVSTHPHGYRNTGHVSAAILWVNTPKSF